MKANKLLLRHKYLRIIELLRERKDISYSDALDIFYKSRTYREMVNGVSDMHCRSDIYLVEEIWLENRRFESLNHKNQIHNMEGTPPLRGVPSPTL